MMIRNSGLLFGPPCTSAYDEVICWFLSHILSFTLAHSFTGWCKKV